MLVFYLNPWLLHVSVYLGCDFLGGADESKEAYGGSKDVSQELDDLNLRFWNIVLSILVPLCSTYDHIVLSMSACDCSVIDV
jgi:hypothetical protein